MSKKRGWVCVNCISKYSAFSMMKLGDTSDANMVSDENKSVKSKKPNKENYIKNKFYYLCLCLHILIKKST